MSTRKRDICRTYRSGNEKRKIKVAKESKIKCVSRAIKIISLKKNSTEIKESDIESLSFLKDQDLHNLPVFLLYNLLNPIRHRLPWASSCGSDSERKNDNPNISFIENCEDTASWPKRLSTAQKDFVTAKVPHKLD